MSQLAFQIQPPEPKRSFIERFFEVCTQIELVVARLVMLALALMGLGLGLLLYIGWRHLLG